MASTLELHKLSPNGTGLSESGLIVREGKKQEERAESKYSMWLGGCLVRWSIFPARHETDFRKVSCALALEGAKIRRWQVRYRAGEIRVEFMQI